MVACEIDHSFVAPDQEEVHFALGDLQLVGAAQSGTLEVLDSALEGQHAYEGFAKQGHAGMC